MLCSVSLRPILKKKLTLQSNQTGTKADIEEALSISASGSVKSKIEVISLSKINTALNRVKRGDVMGKLILDLSSEQEASN